MRRFVIGCIAVLVFVIARPVAAARVAEPPEAPLVEVVIRAAEGGAETTTTGVIWPGGGVLVRLKGIEDAAGATIRSADGVERLSPGVLTYQTEAGVALLAVDWGGEAPASAVIAEQAPRPGDELWLQFIEKGERAALPAEVRSFESLRFVIGLEEDAPAERIAGGPLVNEAGAIVGMPSGVLLGIAYKASSGILPSVWPRAGVTVVRPETLRAIKAGPVIGWGPWTETTAPNIRRARELVDEASKLYWKGQAESDAIVKLLQQAVELDPQNATTWRGLADLLCFNDRYEPALEAAERAISLAVMDGDAYTSASLALYSLDRTEDAIRAAERAIELRNDVGRNYWTIGCCLWKQGKRDEAVEAFKKSQASNPKDEDVKKSLAEVLRRLGRDEEARQYE